MTTKLNHITVKMATTTDHNKLIKKIAKERFNALDIFQWKKSRTFLYDKWWYTIVIEFQPSSSSKGTYLNIGVDFNFYPRDSFAFQFGYREKPFESFVNEQQFSKYINKLCDIVIEKIKELDTQFADFKTGLKTLEKEKSNNSWTLYVIGILYALEGNYSKSLEILKKISSEECLTNWQSDRKIIIDKIIFWIEDGSTSSTHLINLIEDTRKLKKLPTSEVPT
jgi:hypothetical protein